MKPPGKYTCAEYRQEMVLLGLKRRLELPELTAREKERILEEIEALERHMGMD